MRTRAAPVIVALALLAGACAGGTARPEGSASSPSRVSPSKSPAPSGPTPAEPLYVIGPGTYVTTTFRPRVTFTLREEWYVFGEDATGFAMNPGISETEQENLGFGEVERVFEPSNQRVLVKAPKDLVGWFVHHPGLKFVVKPHPVEIGGVRGTELDIELSSTAPPCLPNPNLPSGARCEYFWWSGHGNPFSPANVANGPPPGIYTTTHGDTERDRYVILHVQGHTLVISFDDYPESFPRTVRLFEQLLQTIRFG